MGASGSRIMRRILPGNSGSNSAAGTETDKKKEAARYKYPEQGRLILTRQGSMFFDEDGDLAHEFYEEVRPSKKGEKPYMKKIETGLTPQGEVPLQQPRLHPDSPHLMEEV